MVTPGVHRSAAAAAGIADDWRITSLGVTSHLRHLCRPTSSATTRACRSVVDRLLRLIIFAFTFPPSVGKMRFHLRTAIAVSKSLPYRLRYCGRLCDRSCPSLSVSTHAFEPTTDWALIFYFYTCMGHDHRSLGIKSQGHGLEWGLGQQIW